MSRADAKQQAEAAGAKVLSSVTKACDILVAVNVAGKKLADAQSKGVEIWDEADFTDALSVGGGGKKAKAAKAKKQTSAAAPTAKTAKASVKAGLSGMAAPAWGGGAQATGVPALDDGVAIVDPDLAASGVIASENGDFLDAKLVQVDMASNTDKFYLLQLFSSGGGFYVYSRWGRTGSGGQSKLEGPFDTKKEALTAFGKIYKNKTKNTWSQRDVGGDAVKGLYQHLSTASRGGQAAGSWEYYLTADPYGKPDGWHPYDAKAGAEAEKLFLDFNDNPSMHTRLIFAESSGFTYKVDLIHGQQTNTSSGKARPIRRIAAASSSSAAAAAPKKAPAKAKAAPVAVPKAVKKPTVTKVAAAKAKAAPVVVPSAAKAAKGGKKAAPVVVPKKAKRGRK